MKVLHVYREFHPQQSGVARHIDGLARAGRPLGVEASVFALTSDADADAEPPAPAVVTGSVRRLIAAVADADLVHLHGARTPVTPAGGMIARLLGRPTVYTPHCYYDHGGPLKRTAKRFWDATAERMLTSRAGAVIVLDRWWATDMARRGLRPARLAVIPNCILAEDVRRRRPATPPPRLDGDPALISIGRLDPVKRLDDAVRALALPKLERAVLHLVGAGDDRARLERLAVEIGVAARTVFYGRLPDISAARLLLGADLFLLPSEREGLPTAMLEALLSGVPVIASDIAGNRAAADPIGWTALFPMGNSAALADMITARRGLPVPNGVIADIEEQFTWERRAQDVVALYHEVLADQRRP